MMRATHVVIGVSTGGVEALRTIVTDLRPDFRLPVLVVLHLPANADNLLPSLLNELTPLVVKEAEDKEMLQPGTIYLAPPDYHLLAECDGSLSLTIEDKVNFSRPSIDVLFESAASAFGPGLVGIILTGANHDGAKGLARVKRHGGRTVVQDPRSAKSGTMPNAALAATTVDHILPLRDIAPFLNTLTENTNA